MRRIRFNITSLLVVVLILGVGSAALRGSNDLWDSGLFTLTLGMLLVSILFSVHRTDSKRAFWIGFALFGWIYLGISLIPSIESRLITTKALTHLDSKVPGRTQSFFTVRLTWTISGTPGNQVQSAAFSPDGKHIPTSSLGTVRLWDEATGGLLGSWAGTTENFVRIGHSLLALLVGWLGGLHSRRLWRVSRPPEPETIGIS
jgi:hypothetical protein